MSQHLDQPIFSIIHFNDVYDIQSKQGLGGIVNFKAKVEQLRQQNPKSLLLFSGDCFSPSILSNIKEGWQMVHSLNLLNIDVACFGNHEFDYPHQHTLKLAQACNFPLLMGNIIFTQSKQSLGHGKPYKVLQKFGKKIGIYGVAGQDWIGILSDYYQGQLTYIDSIEYSKKMCHMLKNQLKCDVIIALTHQRNQPDLQYPLKVKEVDLVLGGHDHVILKEVVDHTPVIKSGCNFRQIGLIHIYQKNCQKQKVILGRHYSFQFKVQNVQKVLEEKQDKQLKKYVDQLMEQYKKHDTIIGYTEVDLQTRFAVHRTHETAYGNFFADLMRLFTDSDISFVNSGSIRNDCILPAGPLRYSQISNIINDALVVKDLTGQMILKSLQFSIEGLPNSFKGSFLHVSGLVYTYNSKQPDGHKILKVLINGEQLIKEKHYSVVMYSYISHGGDGFQFLKDQPVIKDQIQTTSMLNLLLKFFKNINQDLLAQMQIGQEKPLDQIPMLKRRSSLTHQRITSLQKNAVKGQDGKIYVSIKPILQRRIVDVQQLVKQCGQQSCE